MKKTKGFTLIELMVAITLATVIMGVIVTVFWTTDKVLGQYYRMTMKWNEIAQAVSKIEENARIHPSFYKFQMPEETTEGMTPWTPEGEFPSDGSGSGSANSMPDPIPPFKIWTYNPETKTIEQPADLENGQQQVLLTNVLEYVGPDSDKEYVRSYVKNQGENTCYDQCHIFKTIIDGDINDLENAEVRTFVLRVFIR